MNRQTEAEPVVPSDTASRIRSGEASPLDPYTEGDLIRQSLGQDRVGVAVALRRGM